MTRFVVGEDRNQSTLFPERLEDYLANVIWFTGRPFERRSAPNYRTRVFLPSQVRGVFVIKQDS